VSDERFRAFVAEHDAGVPAGVRELDRTELGEDGVLVRVEFSSLNYKDGLASRPDGKVARRSPLVVGVDMAGEVIASDDARFEPGDRVIAHGHELGTSMHGGLGELARVPADWVVPLPAGLSTREAMVLGTAGFTAGLSLAELERHGLAPGDGPVLVTGATGGVGSTAVAILAARGYEVHASTGKEDAAGWLRDLGAAEVIARASVEEHSERPLSRQLWAAAVDSCGGRTLAGALASTRYGGAIAASGLTAGAKLETTVMPFILRAVALLGIDSAFVPMPRRQEVWSRLGDTYRPRDVERLILREIDLDGVAEGLATLLGGGARGRFLVRL
jgi:acrylyl-CoA reductase (NADPH)